MQRKQKIIVFIIIVLFLVLFACFFLIITRNIKRNNLYSEFLEQADNAMYSEDYSKTHVLLLEAFTFASSKDHYLKLLKRAFILAKKTDDISVLSEFAYYVIKKKPGDDELVFIAVYAFLKTGDTFKALELLKRPGLTGKLTSLKVEALLQDNKIDELTHYYTPSRPFRFLSLINSDDPLPFEDAGRILEDKRLLLNASLLYAYKGNIQKAFKILNSYLDDPYLNHPDFQNPGIYISYDAGEYTVAEKLIKQRLTNTSENAGLYVLYGDIQLLSHDYEKALHYYHTSLALDPVISESVYLDISYIYLERGDIQNGLLWLKNGFNYFPQSKNIAFEAAKLFLALGKKETAFTIIHTYNEDKITDPYIRLMLLFLDQENIHPLQYRTALWDLYNTNSGNEVLCQFLVLFLLGVEDYHGAESALTLFDMHRGIGKDKEEYLPWVLHYKGICAMMAGAYQHALNLFTLSLNIEENPVILFHRALLYIELKNYQEAQDELFYISKTGMRSVTENKFFLSLVYTILGKSLMLSGEYIKAWEQLERALEIYPDNSKAYTLLKELEELQ